jgi:hypothetical protein
MWPCAVGFAPPERLLMPFIETALGKTLAAAWHFVPNLTSRIEARLTADHRPIGGSPNFHDGERFSLTVSVGPSRSPRRLDTMEFVLAASELAEAVLHNEVFRADYTGPSECRFIVDDAQHPMSWPGSVHTLQIYPSGLVVYRHGLRIAPSTGQDRVALSLDEIVSVLERMHRITRDPRFARVHRRRRAEARQRLDWRIGITPSIPRGSACPTYWRELSSSVPLPGRSTTGQNPSCPVHGFAPDSLRSVRPNASTSDTFRLALEHLMVDAGYIGAVRHTARAALAVADAQPLEASPAVAVLDPASPPIGTN